MAAVGHTPLFGSSDVTALHEWLREELGASTWFAPMIGFRATLDDDVALSGLRSALLDESGPRRWTSPTAMTLRPGTAEGMLVGGNLSLLAMTLAARNRRPPDHSGCIVLLEDITEPTYRLDGYLTALLRAGWFDGVAGIALGSWKECGPLDEIHDLCLELLSPLDVPIAGELGFGHCAGAHSIPLGIRGLLQADDAPALRADTSKHMTTRPDASRAPRSASILKARLIGGSPPRVRGRPRVGCGRPDGRGGAARITGARRRFVLGAATSFTYASLLAAKLSNALAQVTLVDGTIVRPLDILSDVRASDVLIVVSLRRWRGYTIDTALPFAAAGGALVVITDSEDNPLVKHATEAIIIRPDVESRRQSDDLSMHPESPEVSPTVVALVIDILTTLSSASAKGAGRRFT